MTRARNSDKARRICFEAHRHDGPMGKGRYLTCHMCGGVLDAVLDKWRADHIRRHADGGEDTGKNLWPICLPCDTGVDGKAAQDTKAVAKGKRQGANYYNLKEKRSSFQTNRDGAWKKKMDGSVERRR
jgi:hypothetical protein